MEVTDEPAGSAAAAVKTNDSCLSRNGQYVPSGRPPYGVHSHQEQQDMYSSASAYDPLSTLPPPNSVCQNRVTEWHEEQVAAFSKTNDAKQLCDSVCKDAGNVVELCSAVMQNFVSTTRCLGVAYHGANQGWANCKYQLNTEETTNQRLQAEVDKSILTASYKTLMLR